MLAIVVLYLFLLEVHGLPRTPKYTMYFNSDVMVSNDDKSKEFIDTSATKVEWYNETTAYMHGSLKFLKDVGKNLLTDAKLERELFGQREIVFSHHICDLCKEFGNKNSEYYRHLKYIGIPPCPFEAGEFSINNWVLNSEDLPLDTNAAGPYVLTLYFYSNPSGDCLTDKTFLGSIILGLTVEIK